MHRMIIQDQEKESNLGIIQTLEQFAVYDKAVNVGSCLAFNNCSTEAVVVVVVYALLAVSLYHIYFFLIHISSFGKAYHYACSYINGRTNESIVSEK